MLGSTVPTGAEDDNGGLPEGLVLQLAAMTSIDFVPWELTDEEIEPRREPLVAYEEWARGVAADTAATRAEAELELEAAEGVLDDAVDHRADMEEEVEGYSISMWVIGDLGLQEMYDGEIERARQAQPVVAATDALIARVVAADAAIVEAEAGVAEVEAVLAERVAEDDAAQLELRGATQIRERYEHMVVARDLEIARWTDEILSEERPEVDLVTITSVTVQVPIPGTETVAAESAEALTTDPTTPDGVPAAVPTQPTTVAIPPILVNADIASQLQALIGHARSDGINLHGSAFRPREDQITLRIAHCGTSGYDIFERPSGECSPPTARPGASEHEKALAIDFTENGAILNAASPGFHWMVANAGSYGLINLPSEPWHWSTTGH